MFSNVEFNKYSTIKYSILDSLNFPIINPKNRTEKQEYFLNKAAQIASNSNMAQRHGCVIIDENDEILSTGYNHTTTYMSHRWSIHAEIDAIRKIKKNIDLSNTELYVVRIGTDRSGNPLKMSKPCDDCTRQILKSGIGKIYYTWSHIES